MTRKREEMATRVVSQFSDVHCVVGHLSPDTKGENTLLYVHYRKRGGGGGGHAAEKKIAIEAQ